MLLRSRPLRWPAVLPGLAFLFLFFFCHPELVEGSVWLGRGFCILLTIYFTFLLDQKGKKKSRPNDASAHRPLPWPAVWSGRGFVFLVAFS